MTKLALTVDQWAERITAALQKTVESVFETGRVLTAAKKALPRGDWMRLFSPNDNGDRMVPLRIASADQFMRIWKERERLLPNSYRGRNLPGSWRTLYELVALPEAVLDEKFAAGEITPELERPEVIGWRRELTRGGRLDALVTAALEAPTLRYPVLLADPPWRYEHVISESRAIENQYDTAELDDLGKIPVGDWATDDAVMFCWATSPKLAEAIDLLEQQWAFTYRTCLVWVKDGIGMGYWVRQQHELLLIATRGDMVAPAPANRPSSVIEAPRAEHSEKPAAAHELIERMFPTLPKLELFARRPRDGWDVWGNEV
jgi:N6-adenosine-specific RNA methylase IME4